MNADQITEATAAVLKATNFQKAAWQKVIDTGRQYAQMLSSCSYMENGVVNTVHKSEQERYASMFLDNMKFATQRAFLEDAIVGATLTK